MNRLPSFPVPQPGETVHSVVSRHLAKHAGSTTRHLELMGLGGAAAHSLVPKGLFQLIESLPVGHPWSSGIDSIIRNNTLVPLYLSFASVKRKEAIYGSLNMGRVSNAAAALGLTVSAAARSTATYKFCPKCVLEDWEEGFPVSYREHQPPFVRICAKHEESLVFGCVSCFTHRTAANRWSMAGECGCNAPYFEWVQRGSPASELDSWLWLSQQVCKILSFPSSHTGFGAASLLIDLKTQFGAGSGIDATAVAEGLRSAFAPKVLHEFGLLRTAAETSLIRWPARALGSLDVKNDRIPDILQMLVLARLVTTDVQSLLRSRASVVPCAAEQPKGYGRRATLQQRSIQTVTDLSAALAAAQFRLSVAADSLGISSGVLAAEVRHHGIAIPLTSAQLNRLGVSKVDMVRSALERGVPKIQIQQELQISAWSLLLIELDRPKLVDQHRLATIERQRSFHRKALIDYLKQQPKATRMQVRGALVSSVDWLLRYDAKWLAATWPSRTYTYSIQLRAPKNDWHGIDVNCADRVVRAASEALKSEDRPYQITKSYLFKQAHVTAPRIHLLPLTEAAAVQNAETRAEYLQRRLRWALKAYVQLDIPLSMNKFRRLAALPPGVIKEYKTFILDEVEALRLYVDERSLFSTKE